MSHRRTTPRASVARARGEQGASLVLALLVIMVLLIVVAQVFFSAMVEVGHVVNFSEGRRFSFIAEASAAEAKAALMLDLDRDEESGGETGGSGDVGGGLFGGGGDGDDTGESDEEAAADVTSNTDSELDEWANIETLVPSVGDGLTILIDIVDEDSKINLLGLWTEDEEEQERQREIVEKLLTEAFLGTSYAISASDATSLVDRIEDWVDGSRTGNRTSVPKPKLKPSIAEDDAAESEEQSVVFDDERHLPLTLAELQMLEGLSPAQLWGFIEEGEYYPGLVDYLTIWSHLELKPEDEDEDDFSASPFGSVGNNEEEGENEGQDGEGDGDDEGTASDAQPTYNGLINLNTAKYPVLRAVAPDEIPNAYIERIVEFRNLLLDYEEELYGDNGLFTKDENQDLDGDGFADEDTDDDDDDVDDDDDITRFVFADPNSVWVKLEEEFGIEPNFDSFLQAEFVRNFGTRSQVFTIKIMILESLDGAGNDDRYRRRSYRTIVWRMQTANGVEMVTLLPLETFWDPRRIKDLGVEMDGLGDIRGDLFNEF